MSPKQLARPARGAGRGGGGSGRGREDASLQKSTRALGGQELGEGGQGEDIEDDVPPPPPSSSQNKRSRDVRGARDEGATAPLGAQIRAVIT